MTFAAMRTPPWPLLTSPLDGGDAKQLMELWLPTDPDLSSVTGVPSTARAIAAAWAGHTGGTTRCTMRQAMHVLDGGQRAAAARDRGAPSAAARRARRCSSPGWRSSWARPA